MYSIDKRPHLTDGTYMLGHIPYVYIVNGIWADSKGQMLYTALINLYTYQQLLFSPTSFPSSVSLHDANHFDSNQAKNMMMATTIIM